MGWVDTKSQLIGAFEHFLRWEQLRLWETIYRTEVMALTLAPWRQNMNSFFKSFFSKVHISIPAINLMLLVYVPAIFGDNDTFKSLEKEDRFYEYLGAILFLFASFTFFKAYFSHKKLSPKLNFTDSYTSFNNKIVYIGPIGESNKPQIGGYEAANRKNIDALKKKGIHVEELPYTRIKKRNKWRKCLYFLLIFLLPKLVLLKYKKKLNVIHFTPIYKHFIYYEIILVYWCHKLKYKVLLDIRAGAFIKFYYSRSKVYKWAVRYLLRQADIITVESNNYKDFIKGLFPNKRVYYFPNSFLKISEKNKDITNGFNIIYFGRITPAKGIDTMFKVMELLDDSFRLYLAGKIEDGYTLPKTNNKKIFYAGFLNYQELEVLLDKMHFFIFPTQYIGEGQSNSLVEAMSFGLIPFCSNMGFNKEVLNGNGFTFPENDPNDYYRALVKIKNSKTYHIFSENCKRHIKTNHNLEIEINKIIRYYQSLFCDWIDDHSTNTTAICF